MLLPATHFHLHTFPSSSSSQLFPLQFPKPKPKFLICCSTTNTRTRAQTQILPSSAIQQIADKLRSLGITEPPATPSTEITVPFPHQLPKRRVCHSFEPSWSTPLNPVPLPGSGIALLSQNEVAKQKNLKEEELKRRRIEEVVPTLAELSLTDSEIRRLTTLGFRLKQKVRVAKAGINDRIVNAIHERWERSEVVRIVCEDICRYDLRRTHDLLERKTGGLVVWRSGRTIILYRGTDYEDPYFISDKDLRQDTDDDLQHMDVDDKSCDKRESLSPETNSATCAVHSSNVETAKPALILGVGTPNKVRFQLPGEEELAEDADCLLMGLGPRFTDWWGHDPLPVNADLLPPVIRGYQKPFRLLPYGENSKLTDDEMTTLKRLGRNRKLQGLAAAIVKLWERCEIAKIAVKRGVQNTSSKLMAKELKHLTGGTLLSRDREFIVFYRGKDFLPVAVSSAIKKQRNIGLYKLKAAMFSAIRQRRNIGRCKLKGGNSSSVTVTPDQKNGITECDSEGNDMTFRKDTKQRTLTKAEAAIKRTSIKLSMALEKKAKAEKLLAELVSAESPQEQEIDKEGMTNEEKYMLRRIGLMMKPFLLLGRRGVFDGTVENMHLHWKYRELVKIICKGSLEDVHQIAQTLEAESGGILVAVERVRKGYAIIVYRGKNYSKPSCLRPQTLLNKRQALKRSIEAQRRESLKLRVLKLDKKINELKLKMVSGPHFYCSDSLNWNSLGEASVDNQQAILEQPVELIDGGSHQCESENSINWNSSIEASVDNLQAIQDQSVELIDNSGAQDQPENSINWNSSIEVSFDNLQAIQDQSVELIDDSGAHQDQPENSINWNSLKQVSLDNLHAKQEKPVELIDSDRAQQGEPENSINWNSPKEASVELIDGGEAHKYEPESWSSLIHKEPELDGVSDPVAGIEHCISNSKAMESSIPLSEIDSEPSAPMISSNELPSRSVHLSNRERILLRKQALLMIKEPVLAIGKSNIVSSVVKAIKAHFRKHPLAIVNVKGRAKGTSVQELVFKLEQETGAVLVSREPSKVILYRGWWAASESSTIINVNKVGNEEEAKPSVTPASTLRVWNRKRRISRIGKRRMRTGSRPIHFFKRDSKPFFSARSRHNTSR
ncbi:CRM-domain containing factor CFM2, chloroplastic-like isoform X2 [Abrus precatorius]|uniref:CRM-domain containing factor CFM2, chloroplastic-like isoform X2 n=1 Tax=Abrus precatorius TaxID=3816 RepID=A0A8B8LRS5_ABRPR|nr:CRM-domain containing factor CFM2, chloroplastic-like isoform X2 [Abrus precatorius]